MFEQTIKVNLTSVFWAIQKVLPAMIEAKTGAGPYVFVTPATITEEQISQLIAYIRSLRSVTAQPMACPWRSLTGPMW